MFQIELDFESLFKGNGKLLSQNWIYAKQHIVKLLKTAVLTDSEKIYFDLVPKLQNGT